MRHRPSLRLRLTLSYGALFFVIGFLLLVLSYVLLRQVAIKNPGELANHTAQELRLSQAYLHQHMTSPSGGRQSVGVFLRQIQDQTISEVLRALIGVTFWALAVATVVSVVAGWWMAGRMLRPVKEISAVARRLSASTLHERINLEGPQDELGQLADTFDEMLGRLETAFNAQQEFVSNASHELRTPLAIMRTEVDVALADPEADTRDLRAMGEAVRETVDRCERLIESLLTLARSEAAATRGDRVDLSALAGDCITDMRARATQADVEIRADLAPAVIVGDERLFERLIANLLDNAIRYNERGGFVVIHTRSERGWVRLTVSNGGPLIDPDEAAKLTEPFRRLDRTVGGFGLGLSIVRSVAEAHGGRAEVKARRAGGLEVRVELPAALLASREGERKPAALTQS
jgi:signal transduction histidine kinase